MARSPQEATRFTATGPHVSRPSGTSFSPSSPLPGGSRLRLNANPPPPDETPQQKIARLRAAAALANRRHETRFEKTVRIGRVWADRAHRMTVVTIVGFSILTAVVTAVSVTDAILHNRRRRDEWYAQKRAQRASQLAEAISAADEGTATAEQIQVLNRERAALAEKERPGAFQRAKEWLYKGRSLEERRGGRLGVATAAQESWLAREDMGLLQGVEAKVEERDAFPQKQGNARVSRGGPLDREAQAMVDQLSNAGSVWRSWATGRSRSR